MMNRNYRIYMGMAIFLFFGLFSFTISGDGIEWVWFDMISGFIGLGVSVIVMLLIMRKVKSNPKADEILDLRQLERHEIEGYRDEDFV